jgi:hypothetical protein
MKFKMLRAIITAVLLIILCSCSAPAAIPSVAETPEQTDAATSVLQAEPLTGADIESLLSYIADSGEPLESFPALITGADTGKDGCVLHIDRLEYNPEFEIGDLGDETFLINDSVKTEYIEAAEIFYAVYVGERYTTSVLNCWTIYPVMRTARSSLCSHLTGKSFS